MRRFASALYRAALRALPAELRAAHGAEMEALFNEELDEARARGRAAYVAACAAAILDIAARAPYEHLRLRRDGPREQRMRSFIIDLRFALRSFMRQPGSTALIVATLGLAVAANTAVFALLDGLFFKPFPFPESSRLVYLNETAPRWNLDYTGINYPDFTTWRSTATAFESMAAYGVTSVNLTDGASSERATAGIMTYDLPRVLGVHPIVGRTFTADEDKPHGPKVVLIGYDLWQTRFGGQRSAVGASLRVNSETYTIVGVLPTSAEFPGGVKLWMPIDGDSTAHFQSYQYDGVGRLRPGKSVDDAKRDLYHAQIAVWAKDDTGHVVSPSVEPLRATFAKNFRAVGQVLGAAVALVLLIACANVAGTMLARSIFRRREIGVRVALGASAGRVTRQLLTESLALAALSGALGTLGGEWALRAIVAASPTLVPPWVSLGVSARTIAYSFGLVTLAAALFGIAPVFQLTRLEVSSQLVGGGGRAAGSVPQRRLLDALVTLEVVFAVVLLVGCGLLVRAYANLHNVDPGFRPDGVAEFRLALPAVRYRNGLEQRRFFESVVARLDAIPGVDHAGFVTCPPFGCHWGSFFQAEGAPALVKGQQDPVTLLRYASPDYFATMGIQLAHGHLYAPNEGGSTPGAFRPAVVNEELAHQFWPGVADPTGKRFHSRGDTSSSWTTVVGVVKDVKHYGLSTPMRPGLYFPITRIDSASDFPTYAMVVHTTRDAASLFPEIRRAVHELDPELPVYQARTMRAALDASLAQQRTTAFALAAFAAIALALAIGGIYAMLSYVVGRRRHEIGIRIALGAQRRQVSSLVVRQGLRLVVIGLALGLPLSLLGSRALGSLLFGLSAYDLTTYAGVAAVLVITGALAAYIPARRAARVEPKIALSDGA